MMLILYDAQTSKKAFMPLVANEGPHYMCYLISEG